MQHPARGPRRRRLFQAVTALAVTALSLLPAAPAAQAADPSGPVTGPGGKCLDDAGASTANGNPVQLYDCNGTAAQTWTAGADRALRVFGKCLTVPGSSTAPGTKVVLYDCDTRYAPVVLPPQEWVAGPNGSIVNLGSMLCLDSTNGSTANGNPIQIWPCNGTASQTWNLPGTPPPGGAPLSMNAIPAQSATAGVATGFRPAAAGGTGKYQWSATGLPAGVSMNYIDGTTMGAPTATGSSTATVTVTDDAGASASRTFTWTVNAPQTATSWYVDCSAAANGPGTQAAPWNSLATAGAHVFQPGDQLLLKSGSTCNGQLAPQGNGTATAPIRLGSYGTGAKPVINGGGLQDAAVKLTNQSYWIVENLEVTNSAPTEALRSGINAYYTDGRPHAGITIRNNDVHDVTGWSRRDAPAGSDQATQSLYLNNYYLSHGIGVDTPVRGSLVQGLAIVDNHVHDLRGVGVGIYGDQAHGNNNEERHQNVRVAGNTVNDISQDAVVISVSDAPLAEFNTADHLGAVGSGVFAGIWGWGDTNPTFQYNEVSRILRTTDDSTAWDCDGYLRGTCTYQYNYEHDNAGGIITQCTGCGGSEATRIVFRQNVSVNDCRIHQQGNAGHLASFLFHNNVIDCRNKAFDLQETPANTVMADNVFYGPAGATLPAGLQYKANTYVGFTAPASDPQGSTADPKLVDANGTAPYGIRSVGGYQLLTGSPALGSGTPVLGNRGKDYWGNPVNPAAPHRGAFGGAGLATPVRTDDSAAGIGYTGAWSTGGGVHSTTAPGASAAFTFAGSTLSLFGSQGTGGAIASVSIDGGPAVDVNLYAPSTSTGQRVYTSPQLPSGTHTVTLTHTGRTDPRAVGATVALDGYAVS
ncbi:ricin-type beta-trefoil lectin domain protein [Kitasatospora cineracea]|uniref:ricin-type beta-trefoil lectin domain protein n=1 Tax=Kitasatospora cineracea TaxID=88074 RepID=UPI00343B1B79